jgi:hypothetical protein
VVDLHAALVFVDQDERRAGDCIGIDAEYFSDRPDQPGLDGAQGPTSPITVPGSTTSAIACPTRAV